jgi:hypothetical protein
MLGGRRTSLYCVSILLVSNLSLAGCSEDGGGREALQKRAMSNVGELAGFRAVASPKFRKLTADYDTYVDYLALRNFAAAKRELCKSVLQGRLGKVQVVNAQCYGRGEFSAEGRVKGGNCYFTGSVAFVQVNASPPDETNGLEVSVRCFPSSQQ